MVGLFTGRMEVFHYKFLKQEVVNDGLETVVMFSEMGKQDLEGKEEGSLKCTRTIWW